MCILPKLFWRLGWSCTWMDDAGVTLIDGVAAAGHRVAHWGPLQGAFAADHVIFAAASAHNVPLWARAVVVQIPVIWTKQYGQHGQQFSEKSLKTSEQEILCNTISDVYRNREEDESIMTGLVGKKHSRRWLWAAEAGAAVEGFWWVQCLSELLLNIGSLVVSTAIWLQASQVSQ